MVRHNNAPVRMPAGDGRIEIESARVAIKSVALHNPMIKSERPARQGLRCIGESSNDPCNWDSFPPCRVPRHRPRVPANSIQRGRSHTVGEPMRAPFKYRVVDRQLPPHGFESQRLEEIPDRSSGMGRGLGERVGLDFFRPEVPLV
jgi:hypothetical protein